MFQNLDMETIFQMCQTCSTFYDLCRLFLM